MEKINFAWKNRTFLRKNDFFSKLSKIKKICHTTVQTMLLYTIGKKIIQID